MLEQKWKTLNHVPIDDLKEEIEKILKADDNNRVIHIGTDSQKVDTKIKFATCVVLLKPGKGGRAFYTQEALNKNHFKGIRKKLFEEAWRSVTVALELTDAIPKDVEMVVHLDCNPDTRWESSQCITELVGMVVGQGFKCEVKPDAWVASHACDHIVKGKG